MAKGIKGSGLSPVKTETHTHGGGGKWFRTQAEAHAYRDRQNLIRRARRAGFGISDEEIEKFLAVEGRLIEQRQARKLLDEKERRERDRLRKEYGIHPRGHISRLAQADQAREEFRQYMHRANQNRIADSERIDYIKRLYSQKNITQDDLLYRIKKIVGL